MTAPELQVLVVADLARAPRVAAVQGLPELIAELAVEHAIRDSWNIEDLVVGAPIPEAAPGVCSSAPDAWLITTAHGLARLFASVGWQESDLGAALKPDGSGDNEHGWGPWQADIRTHAQLVEAIRAQVVGSPEWWRVAAVGCIPILVAALQEEASSGIEAGVDRYNASAANVARGVAEGDPGKYTTHEHGTGYGKAVLDRVKEWWPAT